MPLPSLPLLCPPLTAFLQIALPELTLQMKDPATSSPYFKGNSIEEALIEVAQPEQEVQYHSLDQLTVRVVVLCFSTFYFGYCLVSLSACSADALTAFYGPTVSKPSVSGLLISVMPLGAMVGAGLAPLLMQRYSRKEFLLVVNALALVVEVLLQAGGLWLLLLCRASQGLFIGSFMAIVPIYINELAPTQVAGTYGVFTQLFVVIGILTAYVMGLLLEWIVGPSSSSAVRLMQGFHALPVLLQSYLLWTNFIPESPNSLLRRNQTLQAREVVALYTLGPHVEALLAQKRLQVEAEVSKNDPQRQQQTPKLKYARSAFVLGFQLPFMQQLTGTNAVVTQANSIVSQSLPAISHYTGIIINIFQVVATLGAVAVMNKYGRREITIFGSVALGVINVLVALFLGFGGWVAGGGVVVLLVLYMVVYGLTLGPVVWLYVPEIIPAEVVPWATMTNWFGCSLCVFLAPVVTQWAGGSASVLFWFFGIATLLFAVLNYRLMVQTKGRSPQEIASLFHQD